MRPMLPTQWDLQPSHAADTVEPASPTLRQSLGLTAPSEALSGALDEAPPVASATLV